MDDALRRIIAQREREQAERPGPIFRPGPRKLYRPASPFPRAPCGALVRGRGDVRWSGFACGRPRGHSGWHEPAPKRCPPEDVAAAVEAARKAGR